MVSKLPKSVTGHGTFIYNAEHTIAKYGGPEEVAKSLKRLDMQHAWIRIHGYMPIHDIEPTKSLVNAIKDYGIEVAGWGWCQGENITREYKIALDSLERFGLSDYIADIEQKVNGASWTNDEIVLFLSKVRESLSPESAIGVSSHGFIHWHEPELMKVADSLVDFFAPQVYWFRFPSKKILHAAGLLESEYPLDNPDSYVRLCINSWKRYVSKPIVITCQAYWGEGGYTQQTSEVKVKEFLRNFKIYDSIVGLNWWHFGGKGQSAMSSSMINAIEEKKINNLFNKQQRSSLAMKTNIELLNLVKSQEGDIYKFGVEVSLSDSNPSAFDCAELVEWACARLKIEPTMPDGSWIQAKHCKDHGKLIDVQQAYTIPGALLFKFSSNPFEGDRPRHSHVAISLGNGKTFEARGEDYGVGTFDSAESRGWTHAARIPGITYSEETFYVVEVPEPVNEEYSINITLPLLSYYSGCSGF
ncbi:MAG: hypothetical protein HQL05_06540 [Nitrospirae bacterium]|uniref:hypothetical protein n=1 Tax=Candidatus Magnetobacterium casense TaxID=1455061 RepID=UPI0006987072|nr:hypothetical protein [Candidatus Magnetobacterium casensis]MBF0337475.1 hypothetical protein [Nitrospirota bacterium]